MKAVFITGMLAAGILLSGCETRVVEHRFVPVGYGYGYYHSDREPDVVYGRTYYRTRNIDRTNIYVHNTYRTNQSRPEVNRSQPRYEGTTRTARISSQSQTGTSRHRHKKQLRDELSR